MSLFIKSFHRLRFLGRLPPTVCLTKCRYVQYQNDIMQKSSSGEGLPKTKSRRGFQREFAKGSPISGDKFSTRDSIEKEFKSLEESRPGCMSVANRLPAEHGGKCVRPSAEISKLTSTAFASARVLKEDFGSSYANRNRFATSLQALCEVPSGVLM